MAKALLDSDEQVILLFETIFDELGKKSIDGIRPSIRSGADTSSVETLSTGLRPVERCMR
jgi:hypothetical protein